MQFVGDQSASLVAILFVTLKITLVSDGVKARAPKAKAIGIIETRLGGQPIIWTTSRLGGYSLNGQPILYGISNVGLSCADYIKRRL